jgi:hypothetical protein
LKSIGFKQTSDPSIYFGTLLGEDVLLGIYVDDVVFLCKSQDAVEEFIRKLPEIRLKNLGQLEWFLGTSISRYQKVSEKAKYLSELDIQEDSQPFKDVGLHKSLIGGFVVHHHLT